MSKRYKVTAYPPYWFQPPEEYRTLRWHFIETEHGVMCASWYPGINDQDCGTWDISGHYRRADNPEIRRGWDYLGPVPMPCPEGEGA